MRLLLIKAERLTETDRWVTNPLGIMYLSAVARQKGHETELLDLRILRADEVKPALDQALGRKPDLVGLSAHSHQARTVKQVSRYIRKKLPDAFQAAGGPIASADTEYTLAETAVDAAVLGEGEGAFSELLDRLSGGVDWKSLAGLAYREQDRPVMNAPSPPIENLDELPYPAWDQMDFDRHAKYLSISLRLGKRACIHTTRGCPYGCIYCQHHFGRTFRGRSPDNVLGEIDLLHHTYGIPHLEIIDDIFNWDYGRATTILERFRDEYPSMTLSFPNAVRGDLMDEPFVRLLKQARCTFIPIAVESGSEKTQKMIRKNLDLRRIVDVGRWLNRYKIPAFACFMVGFPGESKEEMEKTFAFARQFKGMVPVFSLVTPYPQTPLWEMTHPGGERANPEQIDGAYGYRFDDDEGAALLERTLNISRKAFLQPRYWYVFSNEIRWRLTSQWQILVMKLLSVAAPLKWKRKLIRKINQRFELCLE